MDNYYEIEEPKKGFTIGRLFSVIFLAVTFLMLGIIIARCTVYSNDPILEKVLVSDTLKTAYKADDDFAVEEYGMDDKWIAITDGRMVEFEALYHIKSARQLQIGVKYNKDIAEFIGGDGIPFRFYLVDNYSNVYDEYFFEKAERDGVFGRSGYGFIRLCFEGVDLIDDSKEPDENGFPARKTYTLYVERLGEDGEYTELCRNKIYAGSQLSKKVDFELK